MFVWFANELPPELFRCLPISLARTRCLQWKGSNKATVSDLPDRQRWQLTGEHAEHFAGQAPHIVLRRRKILEEAERLDTERRDC